MKPLHCPLRTRKRNKVLFKVIDHLSIDELVWLKSRDQKKALFLDYLHHTYPEQLKLIKAYSETNEILLIFPLEVIDIDLSNLYKEKAGLWGTLSKKILSMCRFKIAHPSYSILYDQDLTVYDLECITEADKYQIMAEAIEDMSRLHCLNIVTIPLSTPEHEKIFKNKRYNRPIEDFTMELALDPEWTCFHDYIAALKRKYNKRASSIRKKMDTLEVRTLEKEEIKLHENKIYALYQEVISKQKFLASQAPPDHFYTLKNIFAEDFVFEAVYAEGEMVAFLTYFKTSTKLSIHYIGLTYPLNETYDLYFNLLFLAVERGIAEGKKCINLGRTSLDAKASLGAVPKTQYTYVKTNCLSRIIEKYVIYQISKLENTSWQSRKPFKTDSSVLEDA